MTFDLGKAQEVNSGLFAVTDSIVEHYESKAVKMFPDLIAEIERLRADNAGLSKAVIDIQEERDLAQANFRAYYKEWEEQAAHVQELEDALVEERAKQFDVDEPCPARTHHEYCDILKGSCDGFPHTWEKCPRKQKNLDAARRQLQAEGKIGPDAKPRSWRITEERIEAILHCKRMLTFLKEDDAPCYDVEKITKDESVLVAMLEAGQ